MSALGVGPILVAALFVTWILVQSAWRHVFGLHRHADVLADRCGCTACPGPEACRSQRDGAEDPPRAIVLKENGHGT